MDTRLFEEKYDVLISLIRCTKKDCTIYLSKIVPRGDIDVSDFYISIWRIMDQWAGHHVKCIEESYGLFFGHNRMPSSRYINEDGIHLSYSGTERLLDAWNSHVIIVEDFSLCMLQSTAFRKKTYRLGGNIRSYHKWKYFSGIQGTTKE